MASAAAVADPVHLWFPETWDVARTPWLSGLVAEQMRRQQPPFTQSWYGDRYRQFALDPEWLARSFIENAEKEAQGSRKLALIAAQATRFAFAPLIVAHAEDEARHARMYIAMLKLTFPEALDDNSRHSLLSSYPKQGEAEHTEDATERPLESLLDDIVQMNIGEIRTRLHQMLLRPVAAAVCPETNRTSLLSLLDRIYEDEGRHIVYTAEILEGAAAQGHRDLIASLYERRLQDFSTITLKEVGAGSFD